MKPTEEQIQAGIDAFYGSNKTGPLFAVRGLVEVILEAGLSASPAGVGVETYKLAAWMVRENDREHWEFVRLKLAADNLEAKGYEVVPLYTRAALKEATHD